MEEQRQRERRREAKMKLAWKQKKRKKVRRWTEIFRALWQWQVWAALQCDETPPHMTQLHNREKIQPFLSITTEEWQGMEMYKKWMIWCGGFSFFFHILSIFHIKMFDDMFGEKISANTLLCYLTLIAVTDTHLNGNNGKLVADIKLCWTNC